MGDERRAARVGNFLACGALVVVIVGLLLATWMPAIVSARQKQATNGSPASQPSATAPASTAPAE